MDPDQDQQPISTPHNHIGAAAAGFMEKEHLFEKVATPSDVGKLNRLVIPKQYAEKYFPLDSSTKIKGKGIILNFQDPNGKSWCFRYSYWTSSQSYVMTKGWSRFVKENQLHAGDLISFQRAVCATGKHCGPGRLYIDCRRRHHVAPTNLTRPSHFRLSKYKRTSTVSQKKQHHDLNMPILIIDSMHVLERTNSSEAKHFRLFGVDLEFCIPRPRG